MIRARTGAHRIEFRLNAACTRPRAELVLDDALSVRLACLAAFSTARPTLSVRLRPTPYQSDRMALLLAILDVLAEHGAQRVETRQIAAEVVFPGAQIHDRAIEWKSSSLRRQTQRLIAAAKSMRDGGFRHLLHGQVATITAFGGSGSP